MEVKYKSKRLEKTLKSDANIKKAFGKAATKVKARHNALLAFETIGTVREYDPLGKWHSLTGDKDGHWAGSTTDRHRMVVELLDLLDNQEETEAAKVKIIDCLDNYH